MPRTAARMADDVTLAQRYPRVREATESLIEPLSAEDCQAQSMPDVSPAKWHLAHTTWFFETFVVEPGVHGYRWFDESYQYLFNSYYNAVGNQFPRPDRGLVTRPALEEILAYRRAVDEKVMGLLEREALDEQGRFVLEVGLNHEQQHQELMLMDIKHVLSCNPARPAYRSGPGPQTRQAKSSMEWLAFPEGLRHIGHDGEGFSFDNERPRHRSFVHAFELASRPVTNAEFLEFIRDGGYAEPLLWLSDGWDAVREHGWRAPLYWVELDGDWFEYTLRGLERLEPQAPVCHVSYFEADAFAEWAGARLPSEAEWETAAMEVPVTGNFVESGRLHPAPASPGDNGLQQLFGDVWEWTRSAYGPYPGYRPPSGALGEYNGKFMCGQYVLRGGCCATPQSHIRATYRNFFYPPQRWQFSGIRLARDTP